MDWTLGLTLAATAAIGLLAGASLDQSLKQLPARHRIGAVAYSGYSRASDLGNGIVYYALLGVSAAVLNIAAAFAAYLQGIAPQQANPVYLGAVFAVLHSLATTRAAPTLLGQRKVSADDVPALAALFTRFERWQTIRCVLQVVNFGIMLWALLAYAPT